MNLPHSPLFVKIVLMPALNPFLDYSVSLQIIKYNRLVASDSSIENSRKRVYYSLKNKTKSRTADRVKK